MQIMSKYLLLFCCLVASVRGRSQSAKGDFAYKPFAISRAGNQVVMAGDVRSVVYPEYYGRDVRREANPDAHARAETLVYAIFMAMKAGDITLLGKLCDSTIDRKNFSATRLSAMVKDYNDIRFRTKFSCGDVVILRYDLVAANKTFAYVAPVRVIKGGYYLTMGLNPSDPFNLLGSLSPDTLSDQPADMVKTEGMTAFYFVHKDGKILVTYDPPPDEYASLYISFESYLRVTFSKETSFIRQLQQAARSTDTLALRRLIAPDQQALLGDPNFAGYYYNQVQKIFRDNAVIAPLEGIPTTDGRVVYFSYADSGAGANVSSVVLKTVGGRYYLALRPADADLTSVLQNTYVREAIMDFMRKKLGQ
jgi:hypothetical protein